MMEKNGFWAKRQEWGAASPSIFFFFSFFLLKLHEKRKSVEQGKNGARRTLCVWFDLKYYDYDHYEKEKKKLLVSSIFDT